VEGERWGKAKEHSVSSVRSREREQQKKKGGEGKREGGNRDSRSPGNRKFWNVQPREGKEAPWNSYSKSVEGESEGERGKKPKRE